MSGLSADAGTPLPEPGPGSEEVPPPAWLDELTPRQIVTELDKYIVGQDNAKKAVAIALRNRWRRQRVADDLREEIMPNNLILIGPTGVGKTEIARRLARLAGAPFVKVEASKFTEVGYVGRDVESMVRDLVDVAVNMVRTEREDDVAEVADARVEDRLLDLLLPVSAEADTEQDKNTGEKQEPDEPHADRSHQLFVAGPSGVESRAAAGSEVTDLESRRCAHSCEAPQAAPGRETGRPRSGGGDQPDRQPRWDGDPDGRGGGDGPQLHRNAPGYAAP